MKHSHSHRVYADLAKGVLDVQVVAEKPDHIASRP
jgi:hypothetical protein